MNVTGIIAEFDPFHGGHRHLIAEAKRLVPDTGIVCVMSGGFTQRGAPSCADKLARARAAVENGADVVFELPVSRALAPAPVFADGGVAALAATGVLTHLAFGSECADLSALRLAAEAENAPGFSQRVRELVSAGKTYAAACALACPEAGKVLSNPNDLLAVEYIRALSCRAPQVVPVPVARIGSAHGTDDESEFPSASRVRRLAAETEPAELPLPQNVRDILAGEKAEGRFPFDPSGLDSAVLAVICRMSEEELSALPERGDGLARRIASAARSALTVEELCAKAKSRNFTLARVRRCVWQAFLGITCEDQRREISYLRVLAVGKGGRELLRRMDSAASVPVVTKPAALNSLGSEAVRSAALEARADSLRSLALPAREDMFRRSPYVSIC